MHDSLTCELLDHTKYLYLQELSEPRDNSLRIVIQEAIANNACSPVSLLLQRPELAALRSSAVPIESTPGCHSFELVWSRYAAYLVTEECVGSCGSCDHEEFTGGLFRVYSKSHFLVHLSRDSGGHLEPFASTI